MPKHAMSASTSGICHPSRAAIAAALSLLASAAFANEAAGPAASGDAGAQSTARQESAEIIGLEQIVVTAQRRAQSLDKVPISIAALSQKTMDDLHIVSFADLATAVPNVVLGVSHAGSQNNEDVAIRGIFSGGNAPTTQIYIDETPIAVRILNGAGPQGNPYPNIFDLDRVEVLRGPQGTLFGSSAMGGVVRYVTPQPNLTSADGFAKVDFGYTNGAKPSYEVGFAYGAPISQGVAGFRVSGWSQLAGGWIDRVDPYSGALITPDANTSNSYVLRPAFTYAPTENLSITPAVFIQHTHRDEPDSYWMTYIPASYQGGLASGSLSEPSKDDLRVPSLAIKYNFAGLTLQSDTSYVDREYYDVDDYTHTEEAVFSGNQFLPGLESFKAYFQDIEYTHAWQEELRLSSQDSNSRLVWVAGAYWRHALTAMSQLIPPDLSPITQAIAGQDSFEYFGIPNYIYHGVVLNSFTNFKTTDDSEAIFGEVTLGITSRLKANLGARFEHSVVKDQQQIVAGPLDGVAYSNVYLPDEVGNPITPRFGVTYQITDNDMVYATAAKGYRAGGGNSNDAIGNSLCQPSLEALGLTDVPGAFTSDSLWDYEVGTKDSMFDRRLALQLSGYYIVWSDIQTKVALPSCSEGFTTNRGKAISRGFELQVQALVGEQLKLNASVGYDDAYYPNAAYGAPKNGVTPLLNDAGDKLPNVLPWMFSTNADYSWSIDPIWSGAKSYLRLDYRYLTAANSLNPNVAGYDKQTGPYQNEAYSLLNIRLGAVNNGLDVSAYVFNATNSDPRLGYSHSPGGSPLFYATAIRPLTWGFTAMYRF